MGTIDGAIALGSYFQSIVLYTIHAAVPMVEVMDTFSLTKEKKDVQIPCNSKSYKFLKRFHSGPWSVDPKNRMDPSKTHSCLGVLFQKR